MTSAKEARLICEEYYKSQAIESYNKNKKYFLSGVSEAIESVDNTLDLIEQAALRGERDIVVIDKSNLTLKYLEDRLGYNISRHDYTVIYW
jgi:hypothetical protein